jgi:hypothetical protein
MKPGIIERIHQMYFVSDLGTYRFEKITIEPGLSSWTVSIGKKMEKNCVQIQRSAPTVDEALQAIESHLLEVLAKKMADTGVQLAAIQEAMRDV